MTKRKQLELWQQEDARRLRQLFNERTKLGQEAFGAEFKIGSQGMVWQYLNGKTPLNIGAASKFAKGLKCSIQDFSPTLAEAVYCASEVTQQQKVEESTSNFKNRKEDLPQVNEPPAPPDRGFDPRSVGDPIARLEQCLNDLLILDGARQQIMALVHEKAAESAAMQREIMMRMNFDRRIQDIGPPENTSEQRAKQK